MSKRTGFSLATEIGVMFVALGLVPMFLIGLQYFSAAETQLRQEISQNLSAIADGRAERIEDFARDRLRDALTLSSLPVVERTMEALLEGRRVSERPIAGVAESMRATDLMLVDASGIILLSRGDRSQVGKSVHDFSAVLSNVVDRARTLLEAQVSDYVQLGEDGRSASFAAAPVLNGGQVIGVVVYRIDEDAVFQIVRDHTGLGDTGEALIGASWGEALMIHGPVRFPEALNVGRRVAKEDPAGEPFRMALNGERGVGHYQDYRGEEVLAAWRYLPSFRWALVVKVDVAERLAPIQNLRNMGFLVLGVAGALIVVVSALMARAITQPISELQAAAEHFEEAEVVKVTPATGAWEINALAASFHDMATRIHAYQSGLRRMVEERTAELTRAKEEAEAATRAKTEFLAVVSHELRTPLNGVLGVAELLRTRHLDAGSQEYVETILQSGGALAELVNDILDISRIEAGKLTVEVRSFDPVAVLQGLEALMRRAAEQKGLELRLDVAEDLPAWVEGDPTRLRQVLLNLLGNAIKFTDQGSVTVSAKRGRSAELVFVVSDTGIGIPQELRQKLFQPFSQLSEQRSARYGGVGLGLAISKRLVEAMGGDIDLLEQQAVGTTFEVRLSLPEVTHPQHAMQEGEQFKLPPLSLLLVEDDATNRMVLEGLLQRDGHHVTSVASASAALVLLEGEQAQAFDLVLTDLRLRGESGLDVAAKAAPLPVIAVTANLMPEDQKACRDAGIKTIVGKPVSLTQLRSALNVAWLDGEALPALEEPEEKADLLNPAYLQELKETMPGDVMQRLVLSARAAIRERFEEAATGDEDAMHRLAGVAGSYGMLALRQEAKRLEMALRQGRAIDTTDLQEDVERALSALEDWCAEHLVDVVS